MIALIADVTPHSENCCGVRNAYRFAAAFSYPYFITNKEGKNTGEDGDGKSLLAAVNLRLISVNASGKIIHNLGREPAAGISKVEQSGAEKRRDE
ncbi:hypothetical protein DQG23_23330 [Paenibacillus contaminans]|uniref:Uncharacterized protein n=1 Tax=Paenibacillus contaminans TaxID=450362 RepID=A0A329MH03_9BACL|nr:hypothetical protein DQG23_23330 [Paenibacillus contaminans]